MENQVNAVILLLSQAQDKITRDFGFCFAKYECFYMDAQAAIDDLRFELSTGCESIESAVSCAFSIIDEINEL